MDQPIPGSQEQPAKPADFYDISGWADEISVTAPEQDAVRKTISAVEAGNLAALEEDPDLLTGPASTQVPSVPSERAAPPAPPAAPAKAAPAKAAPADKGAGLPVPASETAPVTPAQSGGGGGALKALLLVAVLALAAAGAYFGGFIPR